MRTTPTLVRALTIIRDHKITAPKQFAKLMWPDSEGWNTHVKCGHGSHKGGGMYLAAGGYLGKLRNAGLVSVNHHTHMFKDFFYTTTSFGLTFAGQDVLKEREHAKDA